MSQHLAVVYEEMFFIFVQASFVTHFFIKQTELCEFYVKLIVINEWVSEYVTSTMKYRTGLIPVTFVPSLEGTFYCLQKSLFLLDLQANMSLYSCRPD